MVFTVISDQADTIVEELNGNEAFRRYAPLTYTSGHSCMEEAHQHNMSFGKYRTYLELLQYDDEVTIDDCHGMSMGEMHDKIDSCKHEQTTEGNENTEEKSSHHGSHHGSGKKEHGRN